MVIQLSGSQEIIDILRLIRSENVGVKTFHTLIKLYGSASRALEAIPELSIKGGRSKPIKLCSKQEATKEIEDCNKIKAQVVSYKDKTYPSMLKTIDDWPPIITCLGKLDILNTTKIAIVGARNASLNGCKFTYSMANELGARNITVTSGLARGIDTSAHQGSISTGTIAVVAGGIDHIYPPENEYLYRQIAEQGVIVAELPFGTAPKGQHFPQRNRIISGLSSGVLIVEASFGSGSLITARYAIQQNREVFAVPGFPLDPRAQGTNSLIKQGAKLVDSVDDIMQELDTLRSIELESNYNMAYENTGGFANRQNISFDEQQVKEARKAISEKLSSMPVDIDELISVCSLPTPIMLVAILELELAGKIMRHPGNKVSLLY